MPRKRPPTMLRAVREHLTRAHSPLEPVTALLECGHTTRTLADRKRARCPKCRRNARLRQAAARIRSGIVQRVLAAGASDIYCAVDEQRLPRRRQVSGYRVLSVQVLDITEDAYARRTGKKTVLACEALRVACDARAIQYVRAKLLELAEALDGAVVVT